MREPTKGCRGCYSENRRHRAEAKTWEDLGLCQSCYSKYDKMFTSVEGVRAVSQGTHKYDDSKKAWVQIASPEELKAVLDKDGDDYGRPSHFDLDDEWNVAGEGDRLGSLYIRNFETDEIAALDRDVRTNHPAWVHAQLGTTSESELQLFLDNCMLDEFIHAANREDAAGVFWKED